MNRHSMVLPALAALLFAMPTLVAAQPSGRCENGTAAGHACDRVDLLSRLARHDLGAADTVMLNDIWGWTDTLTGRDYALVGKMDGTAFVDVTDPATPRFLGHLPATAGTEVSMWRDIKVFSDHAFIVAISAGAHGMQVFDLTRLRGVEEPREFAATTLYTGVDGAINVAINEDTGFAYLVGSTGSRPCGGGLHMADIRNPASPKFAGCFAHAGTGRRETGYAHDAQCVTYQGPDEHYGGREICLSLNETSLSVADVTDKDNPVPLAASSYPAVAYAHQGWLGEDHRHFYSGDELDESQGLVGGMRILVWDVADLVDPILVGEYIGSSDAREHNMYVRGNRLYVADKRAGLRVLDISDPENPVAAGHFDTARTPGLSTPADAPGFRGAWSVYPFLESGIVLVSGRREGLFVVRPH